MGIFWEDITKQKASALLVFLPLFISPVEEQFKNPKEANRVKTSITVNAGKKAVWEQIKSVDPIKQEELPWSFAHFTGVPDPVSSKLVHNEEKRVRHINWARGVKFKEVIKAWEPYNRFSYRVKVDTIPPDAIDPHVKVGGRHFKVTAGGYKLHRIDKFKTEVTLYCSYQVATKFNDYSRFWAELFLDDLNNVILQVIKSRCEAK